MDAAGRTGGGALLAGFGAGLFGVFVGFLGVFVSLAGELVSGEVVAFFVSLGGGGVGVGGEVMEFGDAVVRALGHK